MSGAAIAPHAAASLARRRSLPKSTATIPRRNGWGHLVISMAQPRPFAHMPFGLGESSTAAVHQRFLGSEHRREVRGYFPDQRSRAPGWTRHGTFEVLRLLPRCRSRRPPWEAVRTTACDPKETVGVLESGRSAVTTSAARSACRSRNQSVPVTLWAHPIRAGRKYRAAPARSSIARCGNE